MSEVGDVVASPHCSAEQERRGLSLLSRPEIPDWPRIGVSLEGGGGTQRQQVTLCEADEAIRAQGLLRYWTDPR
jgi:hypothetical protein